MTTKECKNEIFTLESRELNEGKKVAFIAGGINRDINKANLNDKEVYWRTYTVFSACCG